MRTSGSSSIVTGAVQSGNVIKSSPAIGSDGTIYIGLWDNKLYAINGSGSLANTLWSMFHSRWCGISLRST